MLHRAVGFLLGHARPAVTDVKLLGSSRPDQAETVVIDVRDEVRGLYEA